MDVLHNIACRSQAVTVSRLLSKSSALRTGLAISSPTPGVGTVEWQSGYAFGCNPNYVGSNPASISMPEKLRKGEVAELKAISKLSEKGLIVSSPEVTCSYDFVVDSGDEIYRVQCKSSYTKERDYGTTVCADLTKTRQNNSGEKFAEKYDENEIDAFIVYSEYLGGFYWIDVNGETRTSVERRPAGWSEYSLDERFK